MTTLWGCFFFVIIVNMANVTTKKCGNAVCLLLQCLSHKRQVSCARKVLGRGLLLDLGGTQSIMLALFWNPLFKALCFHLLCFDLSLLQIAPLRQVQSIFLFPRDSQPRNREESIQISVYIMYKILIMITIKDNGSES